MGATWTPVSCVGVGGRMIPNNEGNIYDHFEVNYLYPNGVRAFIAAWRAIARETRSFAA